MGEASAVTRALRFVRTVRHLKPVQIYARMLKRVPRAYRASMPTPRLRQQIADWKAPVPRRSSLGADWRVRFLNADGEIARPEQWNDVQQSKLWLYNLHYFDDLLALDGPRRCDQQRELIKRWIAENPPPAGIGWEPYPVSLRIVNWIKWQLSGQRLDAAILNSLALQARWLAVHVEWHLLGNHVLANAKALVFAGLFFDCSEADAWLQQGLAIYKREFPEQILADGGHFELSPMYHGIILEDLLDLLNLSRCYGRADCPVFRNVPELSGRMRRWLAAMTHPDGGPAFFNDAAFGIAASRDEIEAYADRLGLPSLAVPGEGLHHMSQSGYARLNSGDMAAILDVAAIGPEYIPGHAHADTLSFELSLAGERVIVNGGTSTYAPGAEREAQRATRAHSTVEIDGENSSEVWAAFRVARRARVTALIVRSDPPWAVSARHDGYRRLGGRNVHTRSWRMDERSLTVIDEISGPHRTAVARFHLAPGVALEVGPDRRSGRILTSKGLAIAWRTNTPAEIAASFWHPEFGKSFATRSLEVLIGDGRLTTTFQW